jgi:DNA-binding transcriptional regulator YdaS (Cro superfamily)
LIEQKFKQRRKELEEKEKQEKAEVGRLAFFEVEKQVESSPLLKATTLWLSFPRPVEATPSRSEASAPLNRPVVSPITPRDGSPTYAATSTPQNATTGPNPGVAGSENALIGTPQKEHSRASSKIPTAKNKNPASNTPSNAVPTTPQQEAAQTSTRTPAASAPKPDSDAAANATLSNSHKEHARAPSRTPTPSTATPALKGPRKSLLSTSATSQSTPSKTQRPPQAKAAATPEGCLQGAAGEATVRLPPRNPTKTSSRLQKPDTIKSEGSLSRGVVPPTLEEERRAVLRTPSQSLGEKRKNDSPQNGYSSKDRPDELDFDFGDGNEGGMSAKLLSVKRARTSDNKFSLSQMENVKALPQPQLGDRSKMSEITTAHRQPLSQMPAGRRQTAPQNAARQQPTISRNIAGERSAASPTPPRKPRQGASQSQASQSSSMSPSRDNRYLTTTTNKVISTQTTSPYTLSPFQHDVPSDRDDRNNFDLNRVCYPMKDGKFFSWPSEEGHTPTPHWLRLEKGMYCPYVGGKVGGGKDYSPCLIKPTRIVKLDYCIAKRLVKITRPWLNDPEAYVFFGFTNQVEDFLQSVKDGWPDTKMAKFER